MGHWVSELLRILLEEAWAIRLDHRTVGRTGLTEKRPRDLNLDYETVTKRLSQAPGSRAP